MSRQTFSALVGVALLVSVLAFSRVQKKTAPTESHSDNDLPTERLADELKDAWREHHTTL